MMDDCPFRDHPVIKQFPPYLPELTSCPTCGRTHLRDPKTGDTKPFQEWCEKVDNALQHMHRSITVAVMGCEVNGPGEAKHADIGIALGKTKAAIFKHGEILRTVPLETALDELMKEIERIW